jgi:arylsulfatase A-like enzyme
MIDHWFGRLLEDVEDAGPADSTGVVLCSDHGHYLGEHENRAGTALERELLDAMATALRQIEAPADLAVRMGIG